ncbi:MAG TPA: tetratricopeptide repeat protein [Gemmataceae bacterium]|nr:tetratricopeptide repeat protein [Gemmataceae bacterium]
MTRQIPSAAQGSRRRPAWYYYFLFLAVLLVGAAVFAYPKIRFERKFGAARKELEARHLLSAQDKIDSGLQRWPDDVSFHFLAARCARLRGNYVEAEKHLKRCQDDDELKGEVFLERALIRAARGDLGVEPELQKLVADRNPEWGWILEAIAEGHLKQYRMVEAVNCADQWLQDQPDFPPALRLKAECVNLRAGADEAIPLYQRALERDPDYEEARYQLAQLLLEGRMKNIPAALSHCEVLYRRRPQHLDYQVAYAIALVEAGRAEEARPVVEQILSQEPQLPLGLLLRGRVALMTDHPDQALPWLQKALDRDRSRPQTYFDLAECLRRLGREAEATKMAQRGSEAEKESRRLSEITSRLIPESPHNADLYCEAGEIQLGFQNQDQALAWFARALQEDPKHLRAHRILAEYFEKAGNIPLANFHRQFVLKK